MIPALISPASATGRTATHLGAASRSELVRLRKLITMRVTTACTMTKMMCSRRGRLDLSVLFAERWCRGWASALGSSHGASPFASGLSSKGVQLAEPRAEVYDFLPLEVFSFAHAVSPNPACANAPARSYGDARAGAVFAGTDLMHRCLQKRLGSYCNTRAGADVSSTLLSEMTAKGFARVRASSGDWALALAENFSPAMAYKVQPSDSGRCVA